MGMMMAMMMTVVVVIMVVAHGCYLLFSGIHAKGIDGSRSFVPLRFLVYDPVVASGAGHTNRI
jgi:hypothetical protein